MSSGAVYSRLRHGAGSTAYAGWSSLNSYVMGTAAVVSVAATAGFCCRMPSALEMTSQTVTAVPLTGCPLTANAWKSAAPFAIALSTSSVISGFFPVADSIFCCTRCKRLLPPTSNTE